MLVEFNRFAFVNAFVPALRTSPRVDHVKVRFALREIVDDGLSALAPRANDNDIRPFSQPKPKADLVSAFWFFAGTTVESTDG